MFFFGRRSNYTRAALKEQGVTVPQTKSALFAERLWFGFMLLFALPFLIPFALIALLVKLISFIVPVKPKSAKGHSASKFTDIYTEEECDDFTYVEDGDTADTSVADHISEIVREIEDELPSKKQESDLD